MFLSNGHNLIDKRSSFNGYNGIVLKVKNNGIWGTVAISPIKKDSASIIFGLSIEKGILPNFIVPMWYRAPCLHRLLMWGTCILLVTNDESAYSDCIGICSRYGCYNSRVMEDLSHVGHRTSKIQQEDNGCFTEKTVERLSLCRRVLITRKDQEKSFIFSHEIADLLHINPVQVRRDLMLMGITGSPSKGYNIEKLIGKISKKIDARIFRMPLLSGWVNLDMPS